MYICITSIQFSLKSYTSLGVKVYSLHAVRNQFLHKYYKIAKTAFCSSELNKETLKAYKSIDLTLLESVFYIYFGLTMILLNNIWFLFYNKKCYFKIVIEYPHKSLIVLKWILDEQNQAKLGLTFFSLEFLKGHNANEICFCDRFFIHSSFPTFITSCTEKKTFFPLPISKCFQKFFLRHDKCCVPVS